MNSTRRERPRRAVALCAAAIMTSSLVAVVTSAPVAHADPNLPAVRAGLALFTSGLASPLALAWRPGDARMYAAERSGTVRIVDTDGEVSEDEVLTVTVSTNGERGLLGLAFSNDGTKLYVDYTDPAGTLQIVEYTMSGDVAISPRTLLSIPHPLSNHNGGQIHIGSDDTLYIATGDGGGGGDPDGNGQNLNSLLGKILRIDPTPGPSLPYTIPADNPFVGQVGKRGEIWMYGLRNPWRFSFDSLTSDMWIADVGQHLYEEVNFALAGQSAHNWGWDLREGFHAYEGGTQPADGRDPLFEKSHTGDGYCAIIGGYVYRGSAIADLAGAYLFADLCDTTVRAVVQSGGAVADEASLGFSVPGIATFGEDHDGELYAATLGGNVYKLVQLPPPTVSVGDKTILEGDGGGRGMTFPVTLSRPATNNVTVQYSVTGVSATAGTKAGNGTDFKIKSGTLTFAVNATGKTPILKTIAIPAFGDTTAEPDETYTVSLTNITGGYAPGRDEGTGTIINDDVSSGPTVGVGDALIVDANAGSQRISIPVMLSANAPGPVSVNFTVSPGSATYSSKASLGGDYGGKVSGTFAFSTGRRGLRNITLPVWPDVNVAEGSETFTITLSGLNAPPGTTLIRTTGTGTILDP
jgi:glucose/arabinose dehydrogenase